MPHQAGAARAERHAHSQLFLPDGSARKQQASHIGAGDQEHETHSAQEQHQCRTNVAHDGVLQPGQQNAQAGALRYLAAKLARNHRKIGLCLRQRETRLQPAEDIQEMVASRRHIIAGRVGNGRPYFRAGAWKLERGGHHAYDGIGFLIELDGAADHGAIAAEAPAPQVLAQDSDAVPAPFLSARRKQRAEQRLNSQDGPQACREAPALDLFRAVRFGKAENHPVISAHVHKSVVFSPQRVVIGQRGTALRHAVGDKAGPNTDQALGTRIWQRPQQDGVHDAEQAGIDSHAERDGQGRDSCEAEIVPQAAPGITEILS